MRRHGLSQSYWKELRPCPPARFSKTARSQRQPIHHRLDAARAAKRVASYDWGTVGAELTTNGCAVIEKLLSPEECGTIAALYPDEEHFRSHVVMARHGFGKGEYRYFRYPLPDLLGELRTALYPRLAPVANGWNERMGRRRPIPTSTRIICNFATMPARHGRRRCCCNMVPAISTPCIRISMATWPSRSRWRSCYRNPAATSPAASSADRTAAAHAEPGGSRPAEARRRGGVRRPQPPRPGREGNYRVNLRHGVSRLRSGQRHTLGIIFHDAK